MSSPRSASPALTSSFDFARPGRTSSSGFDPHQAPPVSAGPDCPIAASLAPAGSCATRSPWLVRSGRPPRQRRSPSASAPAGLNARAPDRSVRWKRFRLVTRSTAFPFATIRFAAPTSGHSMMRQPVDSTGRSPTIPPACSMSGCWTTRSSCRLSMCLCRCPRRQPCRPAKGRRVQLQFREVSFVHPFHSLRHRRHAGSRPLSQCALCACSELHLQATCRTSLSRTRLQWRPGALFARDRESLSTAMEIITTSLSIRDRNVRHFRTLRSHTKSRVVQ